MNNPKIIPKQKITAVILAGGRAQRMGGQDKGLLPVYGKPMIEYVIEALRSQVGQIIISANRNLDRYFLLLLYLSLEISNIVQQIWDTSL